MVRRLVLFPQTPARNRLGIAAEMSPSPSTPRSPLRRASRGHRPAPARSQHPGHAVVTRITSAEVKKRSSLLLQAPRPPGLAVRSWGMPQGARLAGSVQPAGPSHAPGAVARSVPGRRGEQPGPRRQPLACPGEDAGMIHAEQLRSEQAVRVSVRAPPRFANPPHPPRSRYSYSSRRIPTQLLRLGLKPVDQK